MQTGSTWDRGSLRTPASPGSGDRNRWIRFLLLAEGASFLLAGLVHFGVLAQGFEHREAGTAETVIGAVLLAGAALAFLRRPWTRTTGVAVQAFALLGTLVGAFTIAVGIGPRTGPDLAYHATILAVLVAGLIFAARSRRHA
jgi:hypothetical protein